MEDAEINHSSYKGTSWFANDNPAFHVGESSRSRTIIEACEDLVPNTLPDKSEELCKGALACCASPRGSDSSVSPEKAKVVSKALDPPNCVNWPGPPMYGHRKKKVFMGLDFLLVSRNCL